MRPAVFFDRDGVVNPPPPGRYVLRASDFRLSEGIPDVIRLCRQRGYLTILVTSQQGVGLGLMSAADLDAVHDAMQQQLARHGTTFDGIYVCPHIDGTCDCRKPSPRLVFDAARDFGIDLPRSILAGDNDRDILMGRNAGVGTLIRVAPPDDHSENQDSDLLTVDSPGALLPVLDRLTRRPPGACA